MAEATFTHEMSVPKQALFAAITNYDKYPEFVDGVTSVAVAEGDGVKKVTFHLNMFKSFSYTLEMREDYDAGKVEWTLLDSDLFKLNTGSWTIEETASGTRATYALELEFKVKVPGFILKKLVKGNLPSMMRGFEKQAMHYHEA